MPIETKEEFLGEWAHHVTCLLRYSAIRSSICPIRSPEDVECDGRVVTVKTGTGVLRIVVEDHQSFMDERREVLATTPPAP